MRSQDNKIALFNEKSLVGINSRMKHITSVIISLCPLKAMNLTSATRPRSMTRVRVEASMFPPVNRVTTLNKTVFILVDYFATLK